MRDGPPDPAHADNTEALAGHRLADKVRRPPTGPRAGPNLALTLASATAQHQHQRQRQIGGGIGQHTGRVRDRHAMHRRRGKVDMIHPDAVIRDHPAAPGGTGIDDSGINPVGHCRRGDVVCGKPLGQRVL